MASILKVDKLDPQSGTALEIGSSGDTITIPSGATFTQSGTMNASAITAGTVATARLGSGTASSSTILYGDNTWAAAAGGITAASQWRLTTSFTGAATPIASNLEVVDTYGYGSLGSAMTESSGIFTFPSTGYWLIEFTADFYYSGDSRYQSAKIQTTTDDSSYDTAAQSNDGIAQAESSTTSASAKASFIFDVTSTSTHKVRFAVDESQSAVTVFANTDYSLTYMTFIRLGDT